MVTFEGKVEPIYVTQIGCSIFYHARFEQTITHQQWESLIDGTAVDVLLCLRVLITHHIFINF